MSLVSSDVKIEGSAWGGQSQIVVRPSMPSRQGSTSGVEALEETEAPSLPKSLMLRELGFYNKGGLGPKSSADM